MTTRLTFLDPPISVMTDAATHGNSRGGRWMPLKECEAQGRQIPPAQTPGSGPPEGFGRKGRRDGPCQEKPLRERTEARTVNRHRWTRRIA